MDEDRAAAARRKIEHYRAMLAKAVDGGIAMIYVVEIAKLGLLLEETEASERAAKRH
jgi:hypothetical protein